MHKNPKNYLLKKILFTRFFKPPMWSRGLQLIQIRQIWAGLAGHFNIIFIKIPRNCRAWHPEFFILNRFF
ncbi:hypothetical protein EB008_03165 [bacterium]|nr:hypothetical protein [bacterium]